jgi:hypothetical protein
MDPRFMGNQPDERLPPSGPLFAGLQDPSAAEAVDREISPSTRYAVRGTVTGALVEHHRGAIMLATLPV